MLNIVKKLTKKYNITSEQLTILGLLLTSKEDLLLYSSKIYGKYELMQNLHRRFFVKFMSGDMDNFERLEYIELADKGKELLFDRDFIDFVSGEEEESDIDELTDKFREKFPDGVSNQYGKRFRGVLGIVKKNLIRFKKEYKQYSDETILLAAEKMVNTMIGKGKKDYISQAHYFIYKDKGSALAEECENVMKGDIIPQVFDEQI